MKIKYPEDFYPHKRTSMTDKEIQKYIDNGIEALKDIPHDDTYTIWGGGIRISIAKYFVNETDFYYDIEVATQYLNCATSNEKLANTSTNYLRRKIIDTKNSRI